MKLTYGTEVIVIKDIESDGFYIGARGKLVMYDKPNKMYQIDLGDSRQIWVHAEDIQKI